MASDWKFIAGGLLTGGGAGLVEADKGAKAREAARAAMLHDLERDERRESRADKRSEAQDRRRMGEVVDYNTDETGEIIGLTRGGEVKRTGTMAGIGDDDKSTANMREARWLVKEGIAANLDEAYARVRERVAMTDEEKRIRALEWATRMKDAYGNQAFTTPEKLAKAVKAFELFSAGDYTGAETQLNSINPKKPEDKSWLKGMFDALGGSGGAGASQAGGSDPTLSQAMRPGQQQPAGAPPGSGTEAAPYQAATQEHVEWFKQNAKPGQVIVVNGRPYTKQ